MDACGRTIRRSFAIATAIAGLFWAASASANPDPCMQDNYTAAGNNGSLNCNSNDVRIAKVTNITPITGISGDAQTGFTCIKGSDIEFTADFQVNLGAVGGARYDIGLYIAAGQAQALTGACNSSIITAQNATNFDQLDPSPDACGDISGTLNSATNPQFVHLDIKTTCTAGAGNKLVLPNCTSWRQPGSNGICRTVADAFPGSPSKCNCDNNFTIDVNVEDASLKVTKTANPTQISENTPTSVTYTVGVTNTQSATPLTLTQLTEDDTNDGTVDKIYDSASTPTLASICGTTSLAACGPDPLNCAAAASTTCTFTRSVTLANAGDSVTDQACVTGQNPSGSSASKCATATVNAIDVSPTATVSKTASWVCSTVQYDVLVTNTDGVESLSLTALSDDKVGGNGNITSVHDGVLGTTCGVASNTSALGTLSASSGAGAFPATLAANGGTYSCKFQAKVCGLGATSNTVTGTLNDNDGNSIGPFNSTSVLIQFTTPAP